LASVTARSERLWRAFGCDVRVVVCGDPASGARASELERAVDEAVNFLEELEARWSRFRPSSELSRLNRDGSATALHADTFALVEDAIQAWRLTGGAFDPTVHDALVAAGYDRSFDLLTRASDAETDADSTTEQLVEVPNDPPNDPVPVPVPVPGPAPGPVGIELDAIRRRVQLPADVHLDLGGIGKGRAADLVSERLMTWGVRAVGAVSAVCVDLGGDVRVRGTCEGTPWVIAVEDPFDRTHAIAAVALDDGAVATSSRLTRRWRHGGVDAHHVIDPATGRPADRGLAAVTVIAGEAQWAEVLAKAALVLGIDLGIALIESSGAAALLVDDDGEAIRTVGFDAFELA